MENLRAITNFFAQIWEVFTVNHPLIGIPFSVIYLGVFAVAFGIMILRPILGIGAGVVNDISRSGNNAVRSARARAKAKQDNSYEAYAKARKQKEEYARRYIKEGK